MATHDYVIDNSTGANVRADLNLVLQAILSNNSSSSAPSTTAAYMWWADTTTGILKIRNSANNAWVELLQLDGTLTLEDGSASTPGLAFRDDLNTGIFSSAADNFDIATGGSVRANVSSTGLNVTGTVIDDGATHDGDVTFTGDSANIVFDKSDSQLEFADNAKAEFGTGGDLEIYHDGSHSVIQETGTGDLEICTNTRIMLQKDRSEVLAKFIPDGAVELYHDNSKKLETTSTGISVTGNINPTGHVALPDNSQLRLGSSDDLKIFHDGSSGNFIDSVNKDLFIRCNLDSNIQGGDILMQPKAGENSAIFRDNGAVELYFDNSKKFETISTGIQITSEEPIIKMFDESNAVNTRRAISNDLGNTASANFTVPSCHGGGTVTVVGLSNGDHTTSTTKQYAIQINGTGTATLSSPQFTIDGSGGSWGYSVSATNQGVSVTNNGGAFGRFRVTFDITAYES